MAKFKRKQLFVDSQVQGALVARVIGYWLSCLLTVIVMVVNWRILTDTDKLWHEQLGDIWRSMGPAFVVGLLLLPIVLYDILRLSNRAVGPVMRLRSSLRALARGERLQPIRFRDGDFFAELAEELNAVVARFEEDRAELTRANARAERAVQRAQSLEQQRTGELALPAAVVAAARGHQED